MELRSALIEPLELAALSLHATIKRATFARSAAIGAQSAGGLSLLHHEKPAERCKSRKGDDGEICGLIGGGCTFETCMIPAGWIEAKKMKKRKRP